MRRPKKATEMRPAAEEKAASLIGQSSLRADGPHVIEADGVYTVEDLRRVFGLKASSVRREVRLGRLRIAKRCGRYYSLGPWVRQWIEEGEVKRHFSHRATNGSDGQPDHSSAGVGPN